MALFLYLITTIISLQATESPMDTDGRQFKRHCTSAIISFSEDDAIRTLCSLKSAQYPMSTATESSDYFSPPAALITNSEDHPVDIIKTSFSAVQPEVLTEPTPKRVPLLMGEIIVIEWDHKARRNEADELRAD
jgi:hypothetical protein